MKTLTAFTTPTPTLLAAGIAFGLGTSSAFAADFRSTYTFADITTPSINTVILNFSTNATSGTITEADLTDWSIELLNGTTSVYLDNVIVSGAVQSIGGVTRPSIDFGFNLDTLQYTQAFDNDSLLVQDSAATGVTYSILGNESSIGWFRYVDGTFDSNGSDFTGIFTLTTEEVTPAASTPEPSTLLGLLAVGSIGALARKRK